MFARLASVAYRRRGRVVLIWLAVLIALAAGSGAIGTGFTAQFGLPDGVESQRGLDILDDEFGGVGGGIAGTIVIQSERQVTDPEVQAAFGDFIDEVRNVPGVNAVTSPFDAGAGVQISEAGDHAGTIAYASIELPESTDQTVVEEISQEIRALEPAIDDAQFEYGGTVFQDVEAPSSELLGIGFAIIVLIVALGSVLAMGLPIATALAGIGVGAVSLMLLSNVVTMPDFATTIGIMIGLGVGIDYALFIVARYRESIHLGHAPEEAISIALDTSGRAVALAGVTVIISLLGMLVMGVPFVGGLGVGAAVVVLVTLVASLTLLPALIGFAGPRIEVTRWRGLIAAGLVAVALIGLGLKIDAFLVGIPLALVVLVASLVFKPLQKEWVHRPPKDRRQTWAYRWSRGVQHHPWRSAGIATLALVVLALPVFGLRLGFSDQGNDPEDSTTRKAYDLLADGFGPGFNGTFSLVTGLPAGTDVGSLTAITDAVRDTPGVQLVTDARVNSDTDPTAAVWTVVPTTSPQDEDTVSLVHTLRDDVLPTATDLEVLVAGSVATNIDFSDYLAGRLLYFFGVVLALSFLLLMAVFRSLLVPVKAVVMNVLSIGAAYGVIVAVFQWGWLSDVVAIEAAPIEPFIPMMLFAIVFGLSMDYEVFLLSRIKEEYDRTGDPQESVADGLAATARIITVAAAIMVVVFGSFMLEPTRTIRLLGAGLAIAVLLDATVVRMLLVPATMELLGDKNWWIPRWLDKLLPQISVEGPAAQKAIEEAAAEGLSDDREPAEVR